jgi:hypothetical protein
MRIDDPFVEPVFARIRAGIDQSAHVTPKMQRFLESNGF